MPDHAITLTDISFGYTQTPVLTDFTLRLPGNAVTAVLGHNGSGKSTVLNLIADVIQPHSGHLDRGGAREVALAPQRSQVTDNFPITVAEAVAMGRWRHLGLMRRPSTADRHLVDHWLTTFHLNDLRRRRLGELSGGQRQRTLLAQAFAQQAPILVLDEPTTGLDAESAAQVMTEMTRLARTGTTVVAATHDSQLARECDCCVVLTHGTVVAAGKPEEVNPALERVQHLP